MINIEERVGSGDIPEIIELPNDEQKLQQLKNKLEEYQARFAKHGEYSHPGLILLKTVADGENSALDALLKARVLGELLEQGSVDTLDFAQRTVEEPLFAQIIEINPEMVADRIVTATGVISAYCDQGGIIEGGTGLR